MADKTTKDDKELQEMFENTRSFIHDGKKYFIDNADIDSVRQADWEYSKTYNEALTAGVTTMAQMQDILEERGIIGKAYDKTREELIAELDTKSAELESTPPARDKEVYGELTEEVEDLRNKLFRHNQRASSPMSNTCEQLAEDARIEYLISAMIKNEEGSKVWDSYESYKTADDAALAMRSRYESMLALQGLDSDFLEKTPEAIARKNLEALEEGKDVPEAKEDEESTEESTEEEPKAEKPKATKPRAKTKPKGGKKPVNK